MWIHERITAVSNDLPAGRRPSCTWLAIVMLSLVVFTVAGSAEQRSAPPPPQPAPQGRAAIPPKNPDAPVIDDFLSRVKEYVALQKKLAGKLTKVPDEATPEQIDKNQRALAALIENARQTAKPGDIFTPPMQAIIRRELARIFKGPEGKQLRASIMDENPALPPLRINARYPATVPISTMPPEVLAALPRLPEELNYRFIGDRLILLDTQADLVIDYVDKALPRV
jgi:hypothetical protein